MSSMVTWRRGRRLLPGYTSPGSSHRADWPIRVSATARAGWPSGDVAKEDGPPMTNWRRELPLGGQAETGIGANRNGLAAAAGDFCATLLAMASHDLRQLL